MIPETSSDALEAWSVDKEVLRRSLVSVSIKSDFAIEKLVRAGYGWTITGPTS